MSGFDPFAEKQETALQGMAAFDYFEGEGDKKPEGVSLERLVNMTELMLSIEERIVDLTDEMAAESLRMKKLRDELIPSAMKELGLEFFGLDDGSRVDIKKSVQANISEANKTKAYAWLEANDFGGLIKNKLSSEFGNGENEDAVKAKKLLTDAGFFATLDKSVHAATLKSFVKEQLEKGTKIPVDLFGVFEVEQAKVTKPKAKKGKK